MSIGTDCSITEEMIGPTLYNLLVQSNSILNFVSVVLGHYIHLIARGLVSWRSILPTTSGKS